MIQTHKICNKCQKSKEITEFPKNSRNKDKLHTFCKICTNEVNKQYRIKNEQKVKESRREYYKNNIESIRISKRTNAKKHTDKKREYDKIYRQNNKEKIKQNKKEWEIRNKDNPIFKIKRNLRRRINHVIKDNYKSDNTFNLIGCSAEFFKKYIESLWTDGMTWENYGVNGWHIDHIKPCYKFDLSKPEQQRICFHYTNQRPLWQKDNLSRKKD